MKIYDPRDVRRRLSVKNGELIEEEFLIADEQIVSEEVLAFLGKKGLVALRLRPDFNFSQDNSGVNNFTAGLALFTDTPPSESGVIIIDFKAGTVVNNPISSPWFIITWLGKNDREDDKRSLVAHNVAMRNLVNPYDKSLGALASRYSNDMRCGIMLWRNSLLNLTAVTRGLKLILWQTEEEED